MRGRAAGAARALLSALCTEPPWMPLTRCAVLLCCAAAAAAAAEAAKRKKGKKDTSHYNQMPTR